MIEITVPTAPEVSNPQADRVKCLRHESEYCPRCDGSGYRPRKRCAGCGQPSGRPAERGKALQPSRAAKSWEEARLLPLYCRECNPRFASLKALALSEKKDD